MSFHINEIWTEQDHPGSSPTTITNPYGTVIPVPTRRYLVQLVPTCNDPEIWTNLRELIPIITHHLDCHKYREPLWNKKKSVMIARTPGHHLIIAITNVSSQPMRSALLAEMLDVLLISENWRIIRTMIQRHHQETPIVAYSTTTIESTIDACTKAARLMTHLQENDDDRTLLEIMLEEIYFYEEIKETPMEVAVEPLRQKKPRTVFIRPPSTRNAGGTRSSCTRPTCVDSGAQTSPVRANSPPAPSRTTETTSMSHSRAGTPILTSGQPEHDYAGSWEPLARELQRRISLQNASSILSGSSSISCVTVAPKYIDVVLRLTGPPTD